MIKKDKKNYLAYYRLAFLYLEKHDDDLVEKAKENLEKV